MPFYAVREGRVPGIYLTWPDAEQQVKGFQNAKYKKFGSKEEAVEFMLIGQPTPPTPSTGKTEQKLKKHPTRAEENVSRKRKIDHEQHEDLSSSSSDEEEKKEKRIVKVVKKRIKIVTETIVIKETTPSPPAPITSRRGSAPIVASNQQQDVENPFLVYWDQNLKFKFSESKGNVFTDGACSNNGYSSAKAGIGIYWGPNHILNVSRKLEGKQTNNRAEMIAGIVAINQAIHYGLSEITVNTDSKLMIKTMEDYIKKWKLNNWKLKSNNDISNLVEVRFLDLLCSRIKVNWVYVPGHKGIEGNERADKLATGAIAKLA